MPNSPSPAAEPPPTLEAALEALRRATAARPADPRAFLELGDLLGEIRREKGVYRRRFRA